jgi:general stress protein 26
MINDAEIEAKFWKALASDRTVMLGLPGAEGGLGQPMTAQLDDETGQSTIWFFTSKEVDLAKGLGDGATAVMSFASKGHEVFASIDGRLAPFNDREMIDRLWNPYVAAWFEGGKDDPKLLLLRFQPANGQIWLNEHSLLAGFKLLLGKDPKEEFKDKVANVDLRS